MRLRFLIFYLLAIFAPAAPAAPPAFALAAAPAAQVLAPEPTPSLKSAPSLAPTVATPTPTATAASGFYPPVMVLAPNSGVLGAAYFSVRADVSPDFTVQQIAAAPLHGFVAFSEAETYPLANGTALWLHFRVSSEQLDSADWSVVLSKPFIDRAEFYFQDPQGVWRMQAAGSRVAHQQWPTHSLAPQFRLPDASESLATPLGVRSFYIRVQKWIPLRFAAQVQRTGQASENTQNTFLTVGLLLGLLGFMVVFSSVLSVVYRNTAYAWYAAYAAAAFLASASFSGIASNVFWPAAHTWPAISTMVFVMLGMAAQIGFTRGMFAQANTPAVWRRLMSVSLAMLLLACAVFVGLDQAAPRVQLFGFSVVGGFAVIAVIVLRALRQDRLVAGLYLLSFAPMLVLVGLTQIEQLGLMALPWLPYNAPIYGLLFELPLLLVALHLHAKNSHAKAVQSSTLARTDPLTGFVAPALYEATLAKMWAAARTEGVDLTVVYVKVMDSPPGESNLQAHDAGRGTLRCVRMLRTVAREDDTIARVDAQVFAILMPGVSRSERLASKLARLVALGVMVDADDPKSSPVKLKIIAGSLRSFAGASRALHTAMKAVLARDEAVQYRVIRFIGKKADQPVEIVSSAS